SLGRTQGRSACRSPYERPRTPRAALRPVEVPANLRLGSLKRVGRAEDLAHQRLEVLQRQSVVVGVERGLVPLVRELFRQRPRLGAERLAVLLAGVGVAAEVLVVVPALEALVDADAGVGRGP